MFNHLFPGGWTDEPYLRLRAKGEEVNSCLLRSCVKELILKLSVMYTNLLFLIKFVKSMMK